MTGPVPIRVDFDSVAAARRWGDVARRQLPFATSVAVQQTASQAVDVQRAHQERVFALRTAQARQFFRLAVQITKRPTKQDPSATIEVKTQSRKRLFSRQYDQILLRHEEGGSFESAATYRYRGTTVTPEGFAIPSRRLRTATRPVPAELYPRNIGAQTRRDPGGQLFFSKRRRNKSRSKTRPRAFRETYFTIRGLGLLRRVHTGGAGQAASGASRRSRSEVLWFFAREIRIRPRLAFASNLTRVATERLPGNLLAALDRAIATAR